MRGLLREQGLEDAVEVDSAGTGDWHVGDAAGRARATAAAGARGVALERRRARRSTPDDFDGLRPDPRRRPAQPARPARGRAAARHATRIRLLREFDPARPAAPDLDVPGPLLRRRRRLRARARPRRGGLPRAARRAARRRPAVTRGGGGRGAPARGSRAARRVPGGDINDAWPVELEGGGRAVRQVARGRAARASTRPRPRGCAWLARAPAGCAVPEVVARSATRSSRLRWIDAGRLDAAGEEELGRGLAPSTRPARRPSARRRRARRTGGLRLGPLELPRRDRGRLAARSTPSTGSRRCCAMAADRGAIAAGGAARRSSASSARLPELAGPPEPPARLHGDLWSGNVLADGDGRPCPDRPRRVRRPPRGRPGDAAAVRRAVAAHARRLRGGRIRSPPGTSGASRSGSCSRCSSTRSCSAAATAPRRARPRARAAP